VKRFTHSAEAGWPFTPHCISFLPLFNLYGGDIVAVKQVG